MKMLELSKGGFRVEYHVIKPGENFPGFGGSSRGLTAVKTPSLIVRQHSEGGLRDVEYDVHDPKAWHTIRWALAHPQDGWKVGADDLARLKMEE
jgi:hypothetical protein